MTDFILWLKDFVSNPIWGGIASLLTIVGIVFAAVYWWVLQRLDVKQHRWEQYQKTIDLIWNVSGQTAQGLQFAAAYQLVEFSEFSYATVRAIEAALSSSQNIPWNDSVGPHLKAAADLLRNTNQFKRQLKKFNS